MTEPTRWAQIKDKGVNWGFAILGVVAFFSILGNDIQGHTNGQLVQKSITVSNRNHAKSATVSAETQRLVKKVSALQDQHDADIANESQLLMGIKAADAELGQFAAWIISVNVSICGGLHLTCPPIPNFAPLPS